MDKLLSLMDNFMEKEKRDYTIKELENIRKKIKKIYDDEYLSNWITTKTLLVIDDRIAELKGEVYEFR